METLAKCAGFVNLSRLVHNGVMNPDIFRAYDIRGLSPEEVDEVAARRIGKALAQIYQPGRVVVGRDMRTTSPALEQALVEGLTVSGVAVMNVGLCTTPMFDVAIGEAKGGYDLGVMITASHNPAVYNGFKIAKGNVQAVGKGSGMEALRDMVLSEQPLLESPVHGSVEEDKGLLDRYLERIVSLAGLPKDLPEWKVAVDAGNGMEGYVLPKLSKKLKGIEVIPLYWELDGSFPNHEANPLKTETLKKLRETVVKRGCAFGAAFDGDADRVGFVDEEGTPIPGDLLTALLAREWLRGREGKEKILYDLRSSWSVPEVIRESGGEPVMCPVGHSHIKKMMRQERALFAGELSMHFYFSDMWSCESGDLAMLLILRMLIREGKPLSKIWNPMHRYVHSGEINFTVRDQTTIMQRLESYYENEAKEILKLDGLRMEFRYKRDPERDWWFSARAANTEPVLRLNLEAKSEKEMEKHKEELTRMITSNA